MINRVSTEGSRGAEQVSSLDGGNASGSPQRVAIVYRVVPHYRRRFYELLRASLSHRGVELLLIAGQPTTSEAAKKDLVTIPWATRVTNRVWRFGRSEVIWQPVVGLTRHADLVVVEQASRLLVNYVLQFQAWLGFGPKVAFWGHGRNFQDNAAHRLGEWLKKLVSKRVHWWFAYNDTSAHVVRSLPFPESRITSVQNAVDTVSLARARESLDAHSTHKVIEELGLDGRNVCIYTGGMYEEKRLPFLISACELIRSRVPDFEMIFIGSGTHAQIVRDAASRHPWIKYLGTVLDEARVPYFAISKLQLMPGLVGLAVLDSFALGVPIVTTDVSFHSPEIEYLNDGVNGIITKDPWSAQAYANTVIELLTDESRLAELRAGCDASRTKYTIEEMVRRFAEGVVEALATKK